MTGQNPGPGKEGALDHNHVTREIRPRGECPACDEYLDHTLIGQTSGSRAALAAEWLIAQQPGPYTRQQMKEAGDKFGTGRSSVSRMIGIGKRSKEVFAKIKSEGMTISEGSRQAGFIEYGRKGRPDLPVGNAIVFGKGDKFWEAIAPLGNYLRAWEKREYEFSHVPPKEAARRLKRLEEILAQMEAAKADLINRADNTRLALRAD